MAIPSSRSLIFEVKSTGSELAFGRPRQTSDVFGRLRTSSGIFGNDRVVFKNPSTPRIKISRLYLRKSWQVYKLTKSSLFLKTMIPDFFLCCGTFLNHNPVNKPAKNNKRMLIAAVFHFVDPVKKDR